VNIKIIVFLTEASFAIGGIQGESVVAFAVKGAHVVDAKLGAVRCVGCTFVNVWK
jgi:hypothetical protein